MLEAENSSNESRANMKLILSADADWMKIHLHTVWLFGKT